MDSLPKPGVYFFYLDGIRLGRLSYRKRGKLAVVETLSGREKVAVDRLNTRMGWGAIAPYDVDKEQAKRFEEILDGIDD